MAESLNGLKRTIMCGELRETHIGKKETVMGWVSKKRNLGGLVFVDLRDRTGIVQVVFGEKVDKEAFIKSDSLKPEYCIAVTGEVVKRESENSNMETGSIEILGSTLKILSESETPPIIIKENLDTDENIRLKYRYLDLRRPDMQKIFIIRHKTAKVVRDFMNENGFLELETPMLTKSTPEGARDYLVPSRNYDGRFYALPQSPQLFKQLFMVSGFDRYFQIVKCFRDEDLRANRQPEFTQIDMEMSFVDMEDVIGINERLIQKVFKEIKGMDIEIPFMRMPYKEVMDKYGSDKPDIRFKMEINDISKIFENTSFQMFKDTLENGGSVRAIKVDGGANFSRKEIDKLGEFVKTYKVKGLSYIAFKEDGVKSSISKFLSEDDIEKIKESLNVNLSDIVFIAADIDKRVLSAMGALRLEIANKLSILKDNKEFKFLWVTEFPLLSYDEEEKRFVAEHHPFTMPMDEDIKYLDSDPLRVRAKAYDIVLNGEELGGGSIRIHDSALQEKMFSVIGLSKEKAWERFGFLLTAFKFGPPPHGGLAFGFDRFIMFLAGTGNIKDVVAFPKNQNAYCPLTDAPSTVDEKQLTELGISLINSDI
ncbi:MAG: aspartate--tRNA ligase [Clostridiaceae bacterium]